MLSAVLLLLLATTSLAMPQATSEPTPQPTPELLKRVSVLVTRNMLFPQLARKVCSLHVSRTFEDGAHQITDTAATTLRCAISHTVMPCGIGSCILQQGY